MKRINNLFRLWVLCVFVLSCSLFQSPQAVGQNAFPLQQNWAVQINDDIYTIVASEDWVIVSTLFNLTAIDPRSGSILWDKEFNTDVDSELLLSGETLIAANSISLKFIKKSGIESGTINFDAKMGSAEVIAAAENYVFVIRKPTWTLEVYDTNTMKLAWDAPAERGGMNIYHGDVPGVVYIITLDNISAINLSNGDVLWQINKKAMVSDYDSGILYYIGYEDNENSTYIAALNVTEGTEIWRKDIFIQGTIEFLNLKTLNKSLITTSQTDLIAFDKSNGSQLWQSESHDQFPVNPILFDNVIYIKGPLSRTVYAISPGDGSTIGYLQFGESTIFSQSTNEYYSRIYLCRDIIVFSGKDVVYGYGK